MQQTTVVMVEPQPLVREGFSLIISAVEDIRIVAQGASLADAPTLVARHRPDVLCLSVRLTDGDARDVTATIRELREPAPYIVLLTGRKDAPLVDSLRISDGVRVLSKYAPPEEIIETIRQVGHSVRRSMRAAS
ncbi:response regulator [Gulosibacter bifidus]|uniref:Response regulator transcription factor n=1 Tax=Gulosibacter bifidus TaxID=272239 RepID=A0ABW5RL09_9MICO|nr:response regulator [Gulosibacter bifidus]